MYGTTKPTTTAALASTGFYFQNNFLMTISAIVFVASLSMFIYSFSKK